MGSGILYVELLHNDMYEIYYADSEEDAKQYLIRVLWDVIAGQLWERVT